MSANSEDNCDLHLHVEIEMLKTGIMEKQNQITAMETACLQEHDRQVELEDSIIAWQDKYDRLYESHKRMQKVNQNLEDKLLKLVDRNSGERAQLTSDVATLSVRLAQANYTIAHLQREIERYKADMGLAIQLLQCKPDSFVPQKITSLPIEIQSKVATYMRLDTNSHSDSEGSTSGVGVATTNSYIVLPASDSPPLMCPFPPTAMVYSMRGLDKIDSPSDSGSQQQLLPKPTNGNITPSGGGSTSNPTSNTNSNNHFHVTPSTMAKFLEDELKSSDIKHCVTCNCTIKEITAILAERPKTFSIGTQTMLNGGNSSSNNSNSLCLRCTSNLNSPSTTTANSPFVIKLYKSNDTSSIVSDTKSNLSNGNTIELLKSTPAMKKDDLTINPLLGHHRLCDRTDVNLVVVTTGTTKSTTTSTPLIINNNNSRINSNNSSNNSNNINTETTKLLIRPSTTSELSNNSNNSANNSNNSIKIECSSIHKLPTRQEIAVNSGSIISDDNGGVNKGSNNSLWSKSSNTASEAAKMFESFNLNLIKAIKAENPKMSGPRLCALRIPSNGSNNILLDNLEPTLSPIVYRRRSKFLDEELSDTKEVILTTTTTNQSKSAILETNVLLHTITSNGVITEQPTNHINSHIAILTLNDTVGGGILPGETSDNKTDSEKFLEAQTQQQQAVQEITQLYINDAAKLMKSESLSNTIALPKEADDELKECVLLRQQQLNRVAEWVQNSNNNNNEDIVTEITHDENNVDDISNMSNVDSISSNNYSTGDINLNNLKSNVNTKCSSIVSSTKLLQSPYKQFLKSAKAQSNNTLININNKRNSPDIAQMEYNVRQFLLKQNEWSIHNKLTAVSKPYATDHETASVSAAPAVAASSKSGNLETSTQSNHVLNSNIIFRTETNL